MGATTSETSVLVADSQLLLAQALASALAKRTGLAVIGEHPDTPEATVAAARRHRPAVVLCDFWLDGPNTTRAILEAVPICKVILMSWMMSPGHISAALQAGATGFLPQGASLADVIDAVRAAATGSESLVFASELARLHETIARRTEQTERWGRAFEKLTPRQRQILRLLSMGKLIQEISKELGIAPVTVKWHIGRMLAETGTGSQAELLAVARYAGVIDS